MVRQASSLREPLLQKHRGRLFCELLEDRNLLNCGPAGSLIEGFDDPSSLAAYNTLVRFYPSAVLYDGAGCDGGLALVDYDGDDWIIRADGGATFGQGEMLSAWVYLGGAGDGRAYLGFGSVDQTLNQRLTTGRTMSVVLAPNTNQLQLQMHLGYKFTGANFSVLGTTSHSYAMDQWYRVEVYWFGGGYIFAALYDAEGTFINYVDGVQPGTFPNTSGGISFRAFGPNSYAIWDSVVNAGAFGGPGSGPGGYGAFNKPNISLTDIANLSRRGGPRVDGIPLPFQYTSTPGTNRDVALATVDQLSHVSCPAVTCPDGTFQGMIGLTVRNVSQNMTNVQVPWGPSLVNHFSNDTPLKTPNFQTFLYRLDPGGEALRIGESGIKAFWSSTDADYQHLFPFSTDAYQTSHNSNRTSFSSTASLDPVTGERYDYSEMGDVNIHGIYVLRNRSFSSPFENLLQVPADELNPALHPGARYFVAANIWAVGDRDVSNNSRWLEYRLTEVGQNRYTFTVVGAARFDICTIPGLTPIGRCAGAAPGGGSGGSGEPVDVSPASIIPVLLTPAAGFTVVPTSQTPAQRGPADTAPVDQLFATQPLTEETPLAVVRPTQDTILDQDFALEFGRLDG